MFPASLDLLDPPDPLDLPDLLEDLVPPETPDRRDLLVSLMFKSITNNYL